MNNWRIISVLLILIIIAIISSSLDIRDKLTAEDPSIYSRAKCYQHEDDLICRISYTIYGDNYEVDKENITSKIIGNDIRIEMPLRKVEINEDGNPLNPKGQIAVNIGLITLFNAEEVYTIYSDDKTVIGSFIYEDGDLTCFTPITVNSIQILTEDDKIKAIANVSTGVCQVYTVDTDNATHIDELDEKHLYTVSLFEKEKITDDIGVIPLVSEFSEYTFEIANISDLENGKYTVKINDREASFVIKYDRIIRILNDGNI